MYKTPRRNLSNIVGHDRMSSNIKRGEGLTEGPIPIRGPQGKFRSINKLSRNELHQDREFLRILIKSVNGKITCIIFKSKQIG